MLIRNSDKEEKLYFLEIYILHRGQGSRNEVLVSSLHMSLLFSPSYIEPMHLAARLLLPSRRNSNTGRLAARLDAEGERRTESKP